MKLLFIILGIVFALIIAILLIGAILPKNHIASRQIVLHRSPSEVYQTVRDFSAAPAWRPDLQRVEMIDGTDGRVRFREYGKQDTITYDLLEDRPDEKIVTRIADLDLGFSGSWTYTFTKEAESTRVRITEAGEVSNILFRFVSRFVFGHTATMEKYLTALGKKLGEEVSPQP